MICFSVLFCVPFYEMNKLFCKKNILNFCFCLNLASSVGTYLEWLLPTREVRVSNLVIGQLYITNLVSTVLKKTNKEAGVGPLKYLQRK